MKFEHLKCYSQAEIDKAERENNLSQEDSGDYEVGKTILYLKNSDIYIDEVEATFILSGATVHGAIWRCVYVSSRLSTSGKEES